MLIGEEDRRLVAERRLAQREGDYARTHQYVAEQSRWMVAQLFIANGGALTALAAADALRPHLFTSGGWFVAGAALAGLSGLGTWAHAQLIVGIQWDWMDPKSIVDPDFEFQPNEVPLKWAARVFWLSVGAGALSLAMFVGGAVAIAS